MLQRVVVRDYGAPHTHGRFREFECRMAGFGAVLCGKCGTEIDPSLGEKCSGDGCGCEVVEVVGVEAPGEAMGVDAESGGASGAESERLPGSEA